MIICVKIPGSCKHFDLNICGEHLITEHVCSTFREKKAVLLVTSRLIELSVLVRWLHIIAHNCTMHMGEGKPWGLAWVSWLSAGGWKAVSMVTMVLALPLILLLRVLVLASFQTVFPWWWCPALTIPQMALTGAWIHSTSLPPRAVCVYTRVAWRPPEIEREWGATSSLNISQWQSLTHWLCTGCCVFLRDF